jgi:hypothetical protein
VGDVIAGSEVINEAGQRWATAWPGDGAGLRRGSLLTVPHIVSRPEQKRALGRLHNAVAADMESAAVAHWCSERGVSFGCVRAISDEVDTPLSSTLESLLVGGRVAPLRLLAGLAHSPGLVSELWQLARITKLAARRLGKSLEELLHSVPCGCETEIAA